MGDLDRKQIWQAALGELQVELSPADFDTWLRNTRLVALEDGVAIIATPNAFARDWLENRHRDQIRRTLTRLLGYTVAVRIVVDRRADGPDGAQAAVGPLFSAPTTAEPRPEAVPVAVPGPGSWSEPEPGRPPSRPPSRPLGPDGREISRPPSPAPDLGRIRAANLNPAYTFRTFVVGSGNRLAHAAAEAVAERPAQAYNPLFIYGGVGLGKTHLLHAIGFRVLERDGELRVLYISAETFTNDLINAIRSQRTEEFRARYRSIDVLLIDDIQFLAGKEQTQEEFFHTFNALHAGGSQIVISCDRPPKALVTLEERLRSRFEWGMIVDVQPPDLETRMAILRAKSERLPLPVPDSVLELIAHRVQSNIRELEGALTRVVGVAQLTGRPLTVELAREVLEDPLEEARRRRITPDRVLAEVASFFGVKIEDLKGKRRTQKVALPRQVAMYLMREMGGLSLVEIGRALGGRDHTTVLHGWQKIGAQMETDATLRQSVLAIKERLMSL